MSCLEVDEAGGVWSLSLSKANIELSCSTLAVVGLAQILGIDWDAGGPAEI